MDPFLLAKITIAVLEAVVKHGSKR